MRLPASATLPPLRQKIAKIQLFRVGSGGRYEAEIDLTMLRLTMIGMAVRVGMGCAVWTAGTAGLGAGAQRLVDNALDGTRAAAAFGAAAKTAIDLLGIPGEVFRAIDRTADIVVGEDVAGTNDHKTARLFSDAVPSSICKTMAGCKRKNRDLK
jgi:hypothetical protein